MWQYFGTKLNSAIKYPSPMFDIIIEPFAGAAGYSLRHYKKNVILIDKNEKIVKIWNWIIKNGDHEIKKLPLGLPVGYDIRNINFSSPEARLFYGFLLYDGGDHPINFVQNTKNVTGSKLKKLSEISRKIKHWSVANGDYRCLDNIEATWFIDPPYSGHSGIFYQNNNKDIDYKYLAEWCRARRGQVIVCENDKADWLPFRPITNYKPKNARAKRNTQELIWSNYPTIYDSEQIALF